MSSPKWKAARVPGELAVPMCHMAAKDGITHMVVKPHAHDEFFYTIARRWPR